MERGRVANGWAVLKRWDAPRKPQEGAKMTIRNGLYSQGRLSDPSLEPRSDPRIKPDLLSALAASGLDGAAEMPSVGRTDPPGRLQEYLAESHEAFNGLY